MDLNTQIIAYLAVNNISYTGNGYATGQPQGQPDQILYWNTTALGAQPNQEQLDEAYPIWEGRQIAEKNKETASKLLVATDWTQISDVPLLNKQEFTDYRAVVRAIAVNPPTALAVFPEKPQAVWS